MENRRSQIAALINREGTVSFSRLKSMFPSVSEMTLRTDLKRLDAEHQIVRIYGGAKSVEAIVGTDDYLSRREGRNMDKKMAIAAKAVGLLHPNMSVFLDSGSTLTEFARRFPDDDYLIFTSGIGCAAELARLKNPKVHMLGGELNRYSLSVHGVSTMRQLENLHFDAAFLGVTCFNYTDGFTCGAEVESELKKEAIRRSDTVYLLMDSQKVNTNSTFSFCGFDQIDAVISDDGLEPRFREECRSHHVQVI